MESKLKTKRPYAKTPEEKDAAYDRLVQHNRENSKKRYRRRKAEGICVQCGKEPAVEGSIACQKCKDLMSLKAKIKYAQLIADGICPACRKQPARKGRKLCRECGFKNANRVLNRYYNLTAEQKEATLERQRVYQRNKSEGERPAKNELIIPELPEKQPFVSRAKSKETVSAEKHARYERLKAESRCVVCTRSVPQGFVKCELCFQNVKRLQKERHDYLAQKGLCIRCMKPVERAVNEWDRQKLTCNECLKKQIAYRQNQRERANAV